MMADLFVVFCINKKKIFLRTNQRIRKNRYTYAIIRNNKLNHTYKHYNTEYLIVSIKINIYERKISEKTDTMT